MSKKNKVIGVCILALIIVVCSIFIVIKNYSNKTTGIEKNYGLAHFSNTITISKDGKTEGTTFDSSKVVPDEKNILSNLKDEGYKIKTYDNVFDSNIKVKQVIAKKGNSYIDISYNLEESEGEEVFELYDEHYDENSYYILALNGDYVYAISDEDAFDDAGFTSLANDGIQFINHNNR